MGAILADAWIDARVDYQAEKVRQSALVLDDDVDDALSFVDAKFRMMIETRAPDLDAVKIKLRAALVEYVDGVPSWCIDCVLTDLAAI